MNPFVRGLRRESGSLPQNSKYRIGTSHGPRVPLRYGTLWLSCGHSPSHISTERRHCGSGITCRSLIGQKISKEWFPSPQKLTMSSDFIIFLRFHSISEPESLQEHHKTVMWKGGQSAAPPATNSQTQRKHYCCRASGVCFLRCRCMMDYVSTCMPARAVTW